MSVVGDGGLVGERTGAFHVLHLMAWSPYWKLLWHKVGLGIWSGESREKDLA